MALNLGSTKHRNLTQLIGGSSYSLNIVKEDSAIKKMPQRGALFFTLVNILVLTPWFQDFSFEIIN